MNGEKKEKKHKYEVNHTSDNLGFRVLIDVYPVDDGARLVGISQGTERLLQVLTGG